MELKSTAVGRHLAQHPYNRVKLLSAGLEVSGDRHCYVIPYTQLLAIRCKRGLVWGELEFELLDGQVVRLHGTEWRQTQIFYQQLMDSWQQWGLEMSNIAADLLTGLTQQLTHFAGSDFWLTKDRLLALQNEIKTLLGSLPIASCRLAEYPACAEAYAQCLRWLEQGESLIEQHNRDWQEKMLQQHRAFFDEIESQPLNDAQRSAIITAEKTALVLAGAGSGKTSVLVARAGWLLRRQEAKPEEILMLAFGRKAAEEMNERIEQRLRTKDIQAKTFHALALSIIQSSSRKPIKISRLESDKKARQQLLLSTWQQQCEEKKNYASGWRHWLSDELNWSVADNDFWHDKRIISRLMPRLDYWLGIIRSNGGSQAEMVAAAAEEDREVFQKRLRLLSPLIKAWRTELKAEDAVDFSGLIQRATDALHKGKFVSPWKHILVDEFQDISPQRATFIAALRQQNVEANFLFAVGDDWQSIYRFSGSELSLTTAFEAEFGRGEIRSLDTTYRFNQDIADVANQFIQQNPKQLKKQLNGRLAGKTRSIAILPEQQLEALLDKMSGFVTPEETVLVLARYQYSCPDIIHRAKTRWPKLNLTFMTIHGSKGQQADYSIILGMKSGDDGFPADERESIIERVLLPEVDSYPHAEERRLLYVALTRARQKVWLLQDKTQPSEFIAELHRLGVPVLRKP